MISMSYLFETSKWKQEALKGNVSNKGLATLTKAGIRKPVLTHIAGINTGTDNIRKKAGAIHQKYDMNKITGGKINKVTGDALNKMAPYNTIQPAFGYVTAGQKDKRMSTFYPPDKKQIDNTGLFDRHEALEAKESKKYPAAEQARFMSHMNTKVLRGELKERDRLHSLYPYLKNHEFTKDALEIRAPSENFVRNSSKRQLRKLDKSDEKSKKITEKLIPDEEESGEPVIMRRMKKLENRPSPKWVKDLKWE